MYLHCVYVGVRYPRFWTPLALPALKLVRPHFRPGAVIWVPAGDDAIIKYLYPVIARTTSGMSYFDIFSSLSLIGPTGSAPYASKTQPAHCTSTSTS
ncbi:hypothetical protein Pdw03_3559 [Penicillium digitatum]|uniref:Uncharacterized protein n=1 Tax=Penicillium digitatum TaxID=36651 RepID=A0A7T6XGG2_PENDI|nr:hypothetical protein Pdw03_3559 [Penicillium digitatum]